MTTKCTSRETSQDVLSGLSVGANVSFPKGLFVFGVDDGTWAPTGESDFVVGEDKLLGKATRREFPFNRIPGSQTFYDYQESEAI